MIVYDLLCTCGCQFEGWFESKDDFLRQQEENLLHCPKCNGNLIRKILSPVAVKIAAKPWKEKGSGSNSDDPEKVAAQLLQEIQDIVLHEYDDVGTKLARESLEMKYGLKEPRNIRGISTPEEEEVLKKEGIELIKIPIPAKKDNKAN